MKAVKLNKKLWTDATIEDIEANPMGCNNPLICGCGCGGCGGCCCLYLCVVLIC